MIVRYRVRADDSRAQYSAGSQQYTAVNSQSKERQLLKPGVRDVRRPGATAATARVATSRYYRASFL